MKILILILNVLGFWLMADVAHAEPISLAIAAISQFIGSISIGKLILTVALNVGLSLIEKALAKKDQSQPAGTKLEISMGDDHPMSFIMGSYATAGRRKYAGAWGDDGKTPNAYFTDVIEIGSLPNHAGERGLTSVWIDDQEVGVLWEEPHPDGRGFPVAQYRVGSKDYLWIKFLDGTQSAPDAFLTAKFGTDPDRPWKSTMIGLGCQVVILTARYNTDLFSGVPSGLYQPHPLRLYDIRKDSSVGGSGAHRWTDPSTWEASSNPAVMIYNLARGVYYGSEWVYGGQNIAAFCLPTANWMAAANACDVAVTLDSGAVEPAFRAGYDITCDQQPLDVVSELLKGCTGRMAEVGGIFKMLVGAPGGAVYSFSDDDIIVTEGQDFQPFPTLSETYNAIEATYPEPAEKWATKDAPGRYNTDLETEDGNRRLPAQVQLLAVPFANQVQRVGLAMIQDYRRFRVHQISLPPDAYPLEPNDVVSWTSARNGYAEKKFLVVKVEPQPNFLTVVTLKEVDPADYDWHSGLQLPTATGWIGPITTPSQPMTGWTVEPATVKDAGGIDRRPAIKISCASDMDDVERVWVQVRLKETGDVVFDSDSTRYQSPFSWLISGQWTLPNTDYEARGRYIPKSSRATDWSSWLAVKTPNILIQASDVLDNAITASKIADAAVIASKIMDEAVTNLKLADAAVSTAKLQVSAVTAEVLANSAVISSKIADAAITAAKLADSTITATKLASSLKGIEVVSALPTTGNVNGRTVYLTTDGKLYRYYSGAWTAAVQAADISGDIAGDQIADEAIDVTKLAAGAVDKTKFATGLTPVEIVSALPSTGNYAGRTVYLSTDNKLYRYTGSAWTAAAAATDITGTLVSSQIADAAITNAKLAALAVDASKLADNAVTTTKITDSSITTAKITANAITADLIAANAINAKQLVLADFENLIADGNFEQGAWSSIWTIVGGTAPTNFYLSTADSLTGSQMLVMDSVTAGGPAVQKLITTTTAIPVESGQQLGWEIATRTADGSSAGGLYYRIYWYDKDKVALTSPVYTDVISNGPINAAWTVQNGRVAVPAAAKFCLVCIYLNTGATTRYLMIDRISLRKAEAANLIVDGSITAVALAAGSVTAGKIAANAVTAGTIAAGAITATELAVGSVTAQKLVLQDWQNLIPDNQLQTTAAWDTLTSCVITPASSQGFTSRGSIDYTYSAGSGYLNIVVGRAFAVEAGKQYFSSVQAIRTSGTTMFFWARIAWFDINGSNLTATPYTTIAQLAGGNTATGIQNYSATMAAPAGAVTARFYIYIQRDTNDGNISFGAPTFIRKASADLIVDGAMTAGKIAASAVTAGTIAANAVTTGTIAAGAITAAQIAAGAITTAAIAANAITTDTLAVGSGKNLLQNADYSAGLDSWTYGTNGTIPSLSVRIRIVTETYAAPNNPTYMVFQNSAPTGNNYYTDVRWVRPDADSLSVAALKYGVSCVAGESIETTAYISSHRCVVELRIEWRAADGTVVSYTGPASITNVPGDSANPNNWTRLRVAGVAPTGAICAAIHIRKYETTIGQASSYMFVNKPMLCRIPAGATEATPWSNGDNVLITAGGIVASAVTANAIAANAVTAGKIATGAVTAGTIAAGAVTASTIAAGTITGDKIAANTIGSDQIAANSITAKSLVLTDFSNIASNGWSQGDLTSWTITGQLSWANDGSQGDASGWRLQSNGVFCAVSQFYPVQAGGQYAFEVWVLNNDGTYPAAVYAVCKGSISETQTFVQAAATPTMGSWVLLRGKVTIPGGQTRCAMALQ
ncbi:MAG: phage tail protein, partial [Rhizobium sp.]